MKGGNRGSGIVTIGEATAAILKNLEVLNEGAIDSATDEFDVAPALGVVVSDALDEERFADRLNKGGGQVPCDPLPAKDAAILCRTGCEEFHCACSANMTFLPKSAANCLMLSRRHFGIVPDVFQLDTVEGVRSRAVATLTVPPKSVIISVAVIMASFVTITVT